MEKPKMRAVLAGGRVLAEPSDAARTLHSASGYGSLLPDGRLQLSLVEALYLLEKGKLELLKGKKVVDFEAALKVAEKAEPNIWIRYTVLKELRNRGYIVKTALKFGADFRVYERGVRPGEAHARWIVYPVREAESLTWYDFAAKNRVAHSTKKRLVIGIVDDEGDVTFYEIRWLRP